MRAPMWMLVPIGILAAGSILAGFPFKEVFAGHGVEEFFRELLKMHPHIIEEMHHIPQAIAFLPTVMMVLGFLVSWLFYIRRPYLPVELANQHQMLYQFLLNKWYFDELYDFIFVRPAKWIGYLLWKKGDGFVIDGFGPGRRFGAGARCHPQRREDPDRLSLSLRLCDADRRRRPDHLVHVRLGRPVMTTWPILSRRHLPAGGRRADDLYQPRRRRSRPAQCALDRAVDHARHLRGVADPGLALRCRRMPTSSSSKRRPGSPAASPTTWASTAFRCRS